MSRAGFLTFLALTTSLATAILPLSAANDRDVKTESVVNGADIHDFLDSGPTLDRKELDNAILQDEKYVQLDQKKGALLPSRRSHDGNSTNSQSSAGGNNQQQQPTHHHPFHWMLQEMEKGSNAVGFPIGPDDEDSDKESDF